MTTATLSPEQTFRDAIHAHPREATHRLVLADYLDEQDRPLDAALERVLAEPDSDARRLEYADVCERLGQAERAEFIRVQVELAKYPLEASWAADSGNRVAEVSIRGGAQFDWCGKPAGDERRALILRVCELSRRERELLRGGTEWAGACGSETPDGSYIRYARGFATEVRCNPAVWLERGGAILAKHPVRAVTLTTRPDLKVVETRGEGVSTQVVCSLPGRTRTATAASLDLTAATTYTARYESWDELALRLLADEFPGVEFTLPPPPPPIDPLGYIVNQSGTPNFTDVTLEQIEALVDMLTLPPHLVNPPQ